MLGIVVAVVTAVVIFAIGISAWAVSHTRRSNRSWDERQVTLRKANEEAYQATKAAHMAVFDGRKPTDLETGQFTVPVEYRRGLQS